MSDKPGRFVCGRRTRVLTWLVLGATVALGPTLEAQSDRHAPRNPPVAPSEILARNLREPAGVATAPNGYVYFTDERAGALYEISASGSRRLLTDDLVRPRGVLWEDPTHLLIVAARLQPPRGHGGNRPVPRGVIVRFDLTTRSLTVLADGLKEPRGLARAGDGTLYVSAEGLRGPSDADEDEDYNKADEHRRDDDDDARRSSSVGTIFRWNAGTGFQVVARAFKHPDGLVVRGDGTLLVAAERFRDGARRLEGSVFSIDRTGAVGVYIAEQLEHPAGLALDPTGGLFVSARRRDGRYGNHDGVILKRRGDGRLVEFATGLDDPRGLALAREGHLILADADDDVVIRYRAPAPPVLAATNSTATNHDPVALRGTALAGTQILVLGGRDQAAAIAATGAFEVPALLRHNQANALDVFAVGAVGDGLASAPASTSIIHDDIAPTIATAVDPPPNAAGWNRADVTVSFLCADSLSGVGACPSPVRIDTEGASQVVERMVTDAAGNSATASTTINLDKTPPQIDITAPANGATLDTTAVAVAGAISDAISGVASSACNGSPLVLSAGQFTCNLSLSDGSHAIDVGATDVAGNSRSSSIAVTVSTALSITIASPAALSVFNTGTVTVSGTTTGPVATVTLNDVPASVDGGTFTGEVALFEGNNTITAVATSPAGVSRTASVTVTLETIPSGSPGSIGETLIDPPSTPVGVAASVKVTASIMDPAVIADSIVLQRVDAAGRVTAVSGTLHDDGLDGDAVAGNRVFSINLRVFETIPGPVTFRVSAAFSGGAMPVLSPPLVVDITGTTATDISILTPANLSFVNVAPIIVTGRVSDAEATVKVNGITATVDGGSYSASVPLIEGTNTITAVATNGGGTISTSSIQTTLDTTPPKLAITSPGDGTATPDGQVTVTGTVNDIVVGTVNDEQARVTVNGIEAQVSNRSFLVSNIPLDPGPNTIQVRATDRSGNGATASIVVRREALVEASIHLISGDNQTAPIGTPLPARLRVQLVDRTGTGVPHMIVLFKVTGNDGTVTGGVSERLSSAAVETDAEGFAETVFTLGSRAGVGNNRVEASATGFAGAAIFVASGAANSASLINADAGGGQVGVVGRPLVKPFVAVVTDSGHNRLRGIPVIFSVTRGGGSFGSGPAVISTTTTTDGDGRALAVLTVGTEDGFDNNVVEATFPGNPGQPAAFLASSYIPGDVAATRITGVVLNNSNEPIVGATMRLFQITQQGPSNNLPAEVVTPVTSNSQGQFVISPAPVGSYKLMADGRTAVGGPWPTLEFDIETVSGRDNKLELPIYLPALDAVNRICVSETVGGRLTLPQVPGFSMTIGAGSATFPGGAREGCVSVTPVNGDKSPMSPGFGQQPRFLITIQPVGTVFNPPAAITFPNVDGLAPRQVTEFYSYDHDLATFVAIGTGTVTADGSLIQSDPGVGVLKAGWHCGGNPNSTGSAGTCPECQSCQGTNCVPTPGSCDDNNVCTRNDRCENGACTGDEIDVSAWTDDLSIQGDVRLPTDVLAKINRVFSYIPGLGGTTFREARVGLQGRAKNCCNPQDGVHEGGEKEGIGIFQLTAEIANIPIWGTPRVNKEFDFGIISVSVDFQFGLVFATNFRINAQGGVRRSECDPNNSCIFGETNVSLDPEIKATFTAEVCTDTIFTSPACAGLTITPLALRMNFAGRLTYNKPSCSDGLGGALSIGAIVVRAEFAVGGRRLVFQYQLFGGIGQL